MEINKICRLCLSMEIKDNELEFSHISGKQRDKFEELTGGELALDQNYPNQICKNCSTQLESFYFYRQELIGKQQDLKNILKNLVQQDEIYEDYEILEEQTITENEYIEEISNEKSQNKNHVCSFCGKIVNTRKDLRSHLRSHNLVKRFACDFEGCEKAFRYQHHLVNHKRIHTQSSPFQCDECTATFRQKYALTLHKRKHERNFIECEKCKSQFVMQNQLKKHNETCDGVFRPYILKPRVKK